MTTDKLITPIVFNTSAVTPLDGLSAWRDWFYPILDISGVEGGGDSFRSVNKVWDIGGILLSSVVAPASRTTRGKVNISRAPIDHWIISYNRRGTTTIATDKSTLQSDQGVPFLWSLGVKSSSWRSDVDRIQLLLPRDKFREIAPILDASQGSMLNTPLGAMLGSYMVLLESHLDSVAQDDLPRLAKAVHGMVAACVAPSSDRNPVAAAEIERGRRERVRQVIHSNLRSPDLTPDMICKAAGISRSNLYRLFEHSSGVLRYIQSQRLLQCHATLSDPENRKSILSVAEEFGFMDASSFRRAFRREFGLSPKEVRSAAEAGVPADVGIKSRRETTTSRFYDLICENTTIF